MRECRRRKFENAPLPSAMRVVLLLSLLVLFCVNSFAQEPSAKPLFTPGGLVVIPPYIDYESVVNRASITELLAVLPEPAPELKGDVRLNPNVWAKDIRVARDVWCLQFSFKPVRLIDVDIPNARGSFDKKKIWYLVYNVENLGSADLDARRSHINSSLGSAVPEGNERVLPVQRDVTSFDLPRAGELEIRQQPGFFAPQPGSDEPVRFVPHFVLAAHHLVLGTTPPADNPEASTAEWQTETTAVAYNERIIPLALTAIMRREGFDKLPETTVSIAQKEIAPGQSVWGVAMWADVDTRINEFSIFISGLTNAYQWADTIKEDGTYHNTGTIGEGRVIKRRVLRTDWWRVGDAKSLSETQFHFGSREGKMPVSPFDQKTTGRLSPEERRKLEELEKQADTNNDGRVSPDEKALFHLIRQDWLKPSFGYEWVFL